MKKLIMLTGVRVCNYGGGICPFSFGISMEYDLTEKTVKVNVAHK